MRWLNIKNWPISAQLVGFSVLISGGAITGLGVMAVRGVNASVNELQSQNLEATLNERAAQLSQKLEVVEDQIRVLTADANVARAMKEFDQGFGTLPSDLESQGIGDPTSVAGMSSYLDGVFGAKLKQEGRSYSGSRAYLPSSDSGRAAQRLYIAENANPAGSKHSLDRAPEDIAYNASHETYHPYLREYVDEFGYYDLFLLNLEGDIVYSVFKETDYGTNFVDGPFAQTGLGEVFRAARGAPDGGVNLVELASYEPSYGAPAWFIAAPLFEGDQRVGVVALQIPTDYIGEILGSPIGETGQTVLIDSAGVLLSDDPSNAESVTLETRLGHEIAVGAIAGSIETKICDDDRGVPVLASAMRLPSEWFDWYLIGSIDRAEVVAPSREMAGGIVINALIIAGCVVPLALVFARTLASPIRVIAEAASEVAQGKLTTRVQENRGDELGKLAIGMNLMTARLAEVIGEVQSSSNEVAVEASQIASGAEEMAAGSETQRKQTSQVSAAVEEMSASVSEVASNAMEVSKRSEDGGQQAVQGGETVQGTIESMGAISEQVNQSVTTVAELGRRSEQIGEIIEVINDIADQTNLLALNAAIEAARAGEHGRGFAVVADEVRKLAERTGNATQEVADSILSIQEETKKAIERMETGKSRVDHGVGLARDAGAALDGIVRGAKEITPMIEGIAAAAQEQSAAANEIARSVEQIDVVTNESVQSVSQIAQSSVVLSQKAETLKGLVKGFEI